MAVNLGPATIDAMMSEMRLFSEHNIASIPMLHLSRLLWAYSHTMGLKNGVPCPMSYSNHNLNSVDIRLCETVVSIAFENHMKNM